MPRVLLILAALLAWSGFGASQASAQTRADSAAVLLDAAKRFDAEGRVEIADALYQHILERFGETGAADEVRRMHESGARPGRSGGVEVQVWGTLYGLWLGVAVPLLADADGPEPYGLGLLAGGPAGFFASRAYARSRPLSEGQARAITWGGTWGTWQGFGWAQALDLGLEERTICPEFSPCFEVEEGDNGQEVVAAMLAGGVAGILTGAAVARRPISRGVATTVNFGSLWGTWFGVAASVLAGLEDDALLTGALLGGNAGLVSTALLAPGWDLSRNRARLISIAGVVGGLGGAGISLLLSVEDEKTAVGLALSGSIVGLALGATGTRGYDRTAADPDPDGDADTAALLRLQNGRPWFDAPAVLPALERAPARGQHGWKPVLRVPLVQARF